MLWSRRYSSLASSEPLDQRARPCPTLGVVREIGPRGDDRVDKSLPDALGDELAKARRGHRAGQREVDPGSGLYGLGQMSTTRPRRRALYAEPAKDSTSSATVIEAEQSAQGQEDQGVRAYRACASCAPVCAKTPQKPRKRKETLVSVPSTRVAAACMINET